MKATYIRVSTIEQNTARQENEVQGKKYIDKISGRIPFMERPEGKKLMEDVEVGKVDCVEVKSLDRLGRNSLDIQMTIERFKELGCQLIVKDNGQRLFNEAGKVDYTFMLMVSVLATMAELENTIRKERQMEGIAEAKKVGKYTGRKVGAKNKDTKTYEDYKAKYPKVVEILTLTDRNIKKTAKLTGASINTVRKIKRMMDEVA